MEDEKNVNPQHEVLPEVRSEVDKKLDPQEVAESKRREWEEQQNAKG